MRKILFFQWHSFMNQGMERALKELGWEYDVFFYQFTDWEKDDKFVQLFLEKIKNSHYTDVLSVNYAPLISDICKEQGIPYTAWVYDSPIHIRNTKNMENDCNRIFFFDRGQAENYQKQGIHAFHMPLAVDTEVFRINNDAEKYQTDISLVGKMYQTEYTYFTAPLSEYMRGYLEGIVNSQMKLYGGYMIPDLITETLLERMNQEYQKIATDGFQMGRRELEFMLACETTGRERFVILGLLSQHFKTALWSNEKDERLTHVTHNGYADYYKQMPYIFHNAKINLNIALRAIQTGIPLRVLDIMGCGGFVLTSYREEIAEHFVNGEECVIYENLEDMYAKAKFYLEHEEERQRIAISGFEKVRRDFTFDNALRRILG